MPVVVVATITPAPGEHAAVREAMLAAVPLVHAEDGCQLYAHHPTAVLDRLSGRQRRPDAVRPGAGDAVLFRPVSRPPRDGAACPGGTTAWVSRCAGC